MNNPQGTDIDMRRKLLGAIADYHSGNATEGRRILDSVLKALSEPSEGMIEAGGKFLSEQWEGDNWTAPEKRTRWCFEAQDAFTAMINHILKEAGE